VSGYPSQTANAMALQLRIASAPGAAAVAAAALLRNVTGMGNVTTSGDIGNRYTWLSLGDAGMADAVAGVLARDVCPGYGCMLIAGETALVENWYDAPSDSHMHAMLGHIDEYFYRYLAGIQQATVGWGDDATAAADAPWAAVRIAPVLLPGLDWVNASFDSPAGLIRVAWTRLRSGGSEVVELTVELPPQVRGHAVLPLSGRVVPLDGGGRTPTLRDTAPGPA
jgi:alpha-L-rhamnosidase